MNHFFSRICALALCLAVLTALMPPVRAAGAPAELPDIIVTPSGSDGHVGFASAADLSALRADGVSLSAGTDSLSAAMKKVFDATFAGAYGSGVTVSPEYVAALSVSAEQGTLYDGGYGMEDDTGSGVAAATRYYFSGVSGGRPIDSLRFVPHATFNGQALISYYVYYSYTMNGTVSLGSCAGHIRISVESRQLSITYSTDGEPVRFSTSDFLSYAEAENGRPFRYLSFAPPAASQGRLYYNYRGESIYDDAVTAAMRFYRDTEPVVDKVFFVPESGYSGVVRVPFTGVDASGASLSGTVSVTITTYGAQHGTDSGGALTYTVSSGESQYITDIAAIEALCKSELGSAYTLSHVRFLSLPSPNEGTLYYDGGMTQVSSTVNYYPDSYHYLDRVRFDAHYSFEGTVEVPFRGYGSRAGYSERVFDGTITFVVAAAQDSPLHYSVAPGKRVYFERSHFQSAARSDMGSSIYRIRFDDLPSRDDGTLYLSTGSSLNRVIAGRDYNDNLLDGLSFLASDDFTGSVSIPFTGYSHAAASASANARSFAGTVVIDSTAAVAETPSVIGSTGGTVSYYTNQYPVFFRSEDLLAHAAPALPGTPTAFTLTRPDAATGSLQSGLTTLATAEPFDTGRAHPIEELSGVAFLPKADYRGTARLTYTIQDGKGNSYTGNIDVTVSTPIYSAYFVDLSNHVWAVPAVDFFRTYGVTTGVSPRYFGPDLPMRRGDFVLLLSRACGFPASGTSSFNDVPADSYYAAAIAAAKALHIISGSSAGYFKPDGSITREEAATYLFRALQLYRGAEAGSAADLASFTDAGSVSSVAVSAMGALVRRGVFLGADRQLFPNRPLTRAETITILYRAFT